jgi:lactoylglutathione lyase
MRYCWTTLHVDDMERSVEFYNGLLGLPITRRFKAGPKMEFCFLGDGDTQVELICEEGCKVSHGEDISIGFIVESIDKMIAVLEEKGIPVHSGPFQPGPGVKFLFVKDPSGVKVQLVENL